MKSSRGLLQALKGSKEAGKPSPNALLNQVGFATELLLDLGRDDIDEFMENCELRAFKSQFDWNAVTERIWRHRNYAMTKVSQGQGDGCIDINDFERFILPNALLDHPPSQASQELFNSLSCEGNHGKPVDHRKDTPICICSNTILDHCALDKKTLKTKWTNYTKKGLSTAFTAKSKASPVRQFAMDFNEDELLLFLKEKKEEARKARRVKCGDLPIPRRVPVIPFLQAVQEEVSQIINTRVASLSMQ